MTLRVTGRCMCVRVCLDRPASKQVYMTILGSIPALIIVQVKIRRCKPRGLTMYPHTHTHTFYTRLCLQNSRWRESHPASGGMCTERRRRPCSPAQKKKKAALLSAGRANCRRDAALAPQSVVRRLLSDRSVQSSNISQPLSLSLSLTCGKTFFFFLFLHM